MRQLLPRFHRLAAWLLLLWADAPLRSRAAGRDRGANVVETIIIVAGFAILAAAIYTAVSGKVQAWIAKMP